MKILIIAPKTSSLLNFRGDLIKAISNKDNEVIAIGPESGFEKELENVGAKFFQINLKKNYT